MGERILNIGPETGSVPFADFYCALVRRKLVSPDASSRVIRHLGGLAFSPEQKSLVHEHKDASEPLTNIDGSDIQYPVPPLLRSRMDLVKTNGTLGARKLFQLLQTDTRVVCEQVVRSRSFTNRNEQELSVRNAAEEQAPANTADLFGVWNTERTVKSTDPTLLTQTMLDLLNSCDYTDQKAELQVLKPYPPLAGWFFRL